MANRAMERKEERKMKWKGWARTVDMRQTKSKMVLEERNGWEGL